MHICIFKSSKPEGLYVGDLLYYCQVMDSYTPCERTIVHKLFLFRTTVADMNVGFSGDFRVFVFFFFPEGLSFPGGPSGEGPTCQRRRFKRCGFDPWVSKIPGGGHNPADFRRFKQLGCLIQEGGHLGALSIEGMWIHFRKWIPGDWAWV